MCIRERGDPLQSFYGDSLEMMTSEEVACLLYTSFEVFHALTDGTGAMHFLMELVKNYLQETHPSAAVSYTHLVEWTIGKL